MRLADNKYVRSTVEIILICVCLYFVWMDAPFLLNSLFNLEPKIISSDGVVLEKEKKTVGGGGPRGGGGGHEYLVYFSHTTEGDCYSEGQMSPYGFNKLEVGESVTLVRLAGWCLLQDDVRWQKSMQIKDWALLILALVSFGDLMRIVIKKT